MGKMPGSRKYTAAQLKKAVDRYFDSISYRQPATRPELVLDADGFPVLDKYGHEIYQQVPVTTLDGRGATVLCFVEPPTVLGLCLALDIGKSTFARWADDEELGDVVAYARARIEAYLSGRLENKDSVRGVSFSLQHNFGWGAAQDDGPREIRVSFDGSKGDPFG